MNDSFSIFLNLFRAYLTIKIISYKKNFLDHRVNINLKLIPKLEDETGKEEETNGVVDCLS